MLPNPSVTGANCGRPQPRLLSGGSRFAVKWRTMRTTRERVTSIHPKLASGVRKPKHMSTALKSSPNLAFKRTPNGRPRNGVMFILAFARPAVWRRLTLR
jgi:hypothetical protein